MNRRRLIQLVHGGLAAVGWTGVILLLLDSSIWTGVTLVLVSSLLFISLGVPQLRGVYRLGEPQAVDPSPRRPD